MAPPRSQQSSAVVDSGGDAGPGANKDVAVSATSASSSSTSSLTVSKPSLPSSSSAHSPSPSITSGMSSLSANANRLSAPPPSYSVLPKMSDPTPVSASTSNATTAGPARLPREGREGADAVNRTSSTSSNAGTNGSLSSGGPYGTRSRNRNGGARPNYAEDKDIDMEIFEMYPERREDDPKRPSRADGILSSVLFDKELPRSAPGSASAGIESSGERTRKPLPNSAPASTSTSTSTSTSISTSALVSASLVSERHQSPGLNSGPDMSGANGNTRDGNNTSNSNNRSGSKTAFSNSHQKDGHNASSSSSLAPLNGSGQGNPRKRKAAASSTDKSSHTAATGQSAHSSAPSKKNGIPPPAVATSSSSLLNAKGGLKGYSETNMLTFEKSGARPKDGKMIADDGTVLSVNDHVYLVCEPPGEPYYLARVMEFLHAKNDASRPVDALRVNWYYRPRDIGRKAQDTRCVFATMHSDTTPLTALRGKCTIKHKAETEGLDSFRKSPDCFWFEKLYDRYIQKNYEVIPTFQIVNVPERVKKVLDERWRYVLVEQGRGKDLTAAAKQCKRCSGFCASNDSVDCAVCGHTYHMNCVRPPLLKKPSRGFAWSCAACSRAQERLLEARHTPNVIDGRAPETAAVTTVEDEVLDEDDEDHTADTDTARASPEEKGDTHPPATAEQQYQASLWPYRYLGIHCRVEDALDYDDRIYPRAATRVGPRHQAVVQPWPGRPVQYVKPPDIKKATRREARQNKEALAAYEREREKRPKWIQDMPPGYVHRGLDLEEDDPECTSTLVYKTPPSALDAALPGPLETVSGARTSDGNGRRPPDPDAMQTEPDSPGPTDAGAARVCGSEIDAYMDDAVSRAEKLGLPPRSTNLYHMAMVLLYKNRFDFQNALAELERLPKAEFKEPNLAPAQLKRFEEAVSMFGSELNLVTRHVKTVFYGDIVRYYYTWKKTDRGRQIWGNNASRKGKKEAKEAKEGKDSKKSEATVANKIQDDVADDVDDSAFDEDKAARMKRQFSCKFCNTKTSRQWRRAPNTPPTAVLGESLGGGSSKHSSREKTQQQNQQQYVPALCRRCAELWRRYAVQWEDIEALTQKVANMGGRLVKRKMDEELLKEIASADDIMRITEANYGTSRQRQQQNNVLATSHRSQEPPRKKLKGQTSTGNSDSTSDPNTSDAAVSATSKRKDRSDKTSTEKGDKSDKTASATASVITNVGKAGTTNGPPSRAVSHSSVGLSDPEIPEPRPLPCAVCYQMELPTGSPRLSCRDCRLTVHRSCYGVGSNRPSGKWICDMCSNDRNPQVSIDYRCVLCPVVKTVHDPIEPPRPAQRKKLEKDRERDRVEREQMLKVDEYYRRRQKELNKPVCPREALKRTADNNWVHVTCAVWTPEVKFGNASLLEPSEGIPSVARARYEEVCKVCKHRGGACIACHQCKVLFHIECAHQAGHIFGFDLVQVKSSRRDKTSNGVCGQMAAAIWCKEHVPLKGSVHLMHEVIDDSVLTALQLYVQNYKQADLALTGCARKANLLSLAAKLTCATVNSPSSIDVHYSHGQQSSQSLGPNGSRRATTAHIDSSKEHTLSAEALRPGGKICLTCGSDISPKWYPIDEAQERDLTNGFRGKLGVEAQKFVAQRNFQCHRCRKTGQHPLPDYANVKIEEDAFGDSLHSVALQHQQPHRHRRYSNEYNREPAKAESHRQSQSTRASSSAQTGPATVIPLRSPDLTRYWTAGNAGTSRGGCVSPPLPTSQLPSLSHQVPSLSAMHSLPEAGPSSASQSSGPPSQPQSSAISSQVPLVSHTSLSPPIPPIHHSTAPPPSLSQQPVHSYHGSSSTSAAYADWRRSSSGSATAQTMSLPGRPEALPHPASNVTRNLLRPPPLTNLPPSLSGGHMELQSVGELSPPPRRLGVQNPTTTTSTALGGVLSSANSSGTYARSYPPPNPQLPCHQL